MGVVAFLEDVSKYGQISLIGSFRIKVVLGEGAEAPSSCILTEVSGVRELTLKSQIVIISDLNTEPLAERLVVATNQPNVIHTCSKLD